MARKELEGYISSFVHLAIRCSGTTARSIIIGENSVVSGWDLAVTVMGNVGR